LGTGLLELADAGGGPEPTRFRVTGAESSILVGAVSDAPAADLVPPTGEILFAGGRIELADATLHVQRAGRVSGLGSVVGTGTASVVNDGVIGCGVEIDAPYVQGDEGTLECPQASLPAVPFLDPLSASAFARAVRARPVPPAPPPAGPFVVSGDAALGGTLVLRFLNGFAPAAGAAFPILDASGIVSGGFANVVVQGLVPGSFDFSSATKGGVTSFLSLTDAEALPVVTLTGKTKLKEKKKGGLKLTVAREGDAGAALPVSYRVGGTARHGVDFETLSGTIEIPAGKRSAKLVIRPRADGAVESPETIEVSLLPGDGYSVGLFSTVQIELASADKLKPAKAKRR
ncbi:MAG TPA: hypothetical protein VNE71_10955, partial [Myxococcota bacterium]|nr:hypothetical protein [Myxococcota bacterium]